MVLLTYTIGLPSINCETVREVSERPRKVGMHACLPTSPYYTCEYFVCVCASVYVCVSTPPPYYITALDYANGHYYAKLISFILSRPAKFADKPQQVKLGRARQSR